MKDNLSIVITMLVFVILIVIFPLYNYFERQDDMSYNLAFKATTNFVDEVLESGYLTQEMYDNYINVLSDTGNFYDIQLEAHRKILIQDVDNPEEYNEQYLINYNKDIFDESTGSIIQNIDQKVIKDGAYYFNEGDQFYVKMKNSNTTMAGAIFNVIVPTASKDRIVVNYGGVIKNQAWAKVDATYRAASTESSSMVIRTDIPGYEEVINSTGASVSVDADGTKTVTFTPAYTGSTDWWNDIIGFEWTIEHNSIVVATKEIGIDAQAWSYVFNESEIPYKVTLVGRFREGGNTESIFMNIKVSDTIAYFSGRNLEIIIDALSGESIKDYSFKVALDKEHSWGNDFITIEGSYDGENWNTIKNYKMPSFTKFTEVNASRIVNSDSVTLEDRNYTFAIARIDGQLEENYSFIKFKYTVASGHTYCIIRNSNIKYSVTYK